MTIPSEKELKEAVERFQVCDWVNPDNRKACNTLLDLANLVLSCQGGLPKKIKGRKVDVLPFGYWEKCQGYDQAKNEIAEREVFIDTEKLIDIMAETIHGNKDAKFYGLEYHKYLEIASAIAEEILKGNVLKIVEDK